MIFVNDFNHFKFKSSYLNVSKLKAKGRKDPSQMSRWILIPSKRIRVYSREENPELTFDPFDNKLNFCF